MIILSIPYINNRYIEELDNSMRSYRYLYEYRLDFHASPWNFPIEHLDDNSIITIREPQEGGIGEHDFTRKINFYKKAIEQTNCLVDLELLTSGKHALSTDNLILSYHEISGNLDTEKISEIINLSNQKKSRYLKLAIPCNNYGDLNIIADLIKNSHKPILWAGLGKLGKLSRLLFSMLGATGTYIGRAGHEIVPDQLTDKEFFNFRHLVGKIQFKIGGLIGGDQVWSSLGLRFYNEYFRKKQMAAAYLPFPVEDLTDFQIWLHSDRILPEVYGFSVTMPWKKKILPETMSDAISANLYLPGLEELHDTDSRAFRKAFDYLGIKVDDKILIIGSGVMAETAMALLNSRKYGYIHARNKSKAQELARQYRFTFLSSEQLPNFFIDLLINCTPVGMNGENLLQVFQLQKPPKAIDLPYSPQEHTILTQICHTENLPCVDGRLFWKWQAEAQLKIFKKQLRR
ncbi:MAG: type I 3-dehydroquinate dehydratase [Candidatus Cloacimonetes bacterium]|nr:type I 3-dehydroquinate dehydratase [Candidatus Cloacimonadota bacterium]